MSGHDGERHCAHFRSFEHFFLPVDGEELSPSLPTLSPFDGITVGVVEGEAGFAVVAAGFEVATGGFEVVAAAGFEVAGVVAPLPLPFFTDTHCSRWYTKGLPKSESVSMERADSARATRMHT